MSRLTPSLVEIQDGALNLNFHPGQAEAWTSDKRFVFVLAGTQGGKTSFGPWWLMREIQRCGSGDYIAATASYDLFKLKMLPALQECFVHRLGWGRYWPSDRLIELADPETGKFLARRASQPMWGRIILRSASAEGGLESATAKAAWLDECGQDDFGGEAWEAVLRRLSIHQGRILGTTTLYNLGWIVSQVYEPWQRGEPEFDVIQFDSRINPLFPDAEQERARRSLPAWKYEMFYRGRVTKPAGLIYDCFETRTHAIDPFPIPAYWRWWLGIDFGGANTAILWLAEDPEGRRFYVVEESLEGGLSTKEHVAQVAEKRLGRRVAGVWGGSKGEEQSRRDWRGEGLNVQEPPIADVEVGISRVTGLIKTDRLFVFRSCPGLLHEFGTYRRPLDDQGEPMEGIEQKHIFHRLDGLRYVCAGLTGGLDDNLLAGLSLVGRVGGGWGVSR